jgi:hypothetical protein
MEKMIDTTAEAAAVQAAVHRKLSSVQRLTTALEMSIMMRELSAARLKRDHPEWSDAEIKRELLRYAFGRNTLPEPLR